MNVFLREMKAHRRGLFFWCLGIVFLVYSGMAKYGAYEASGQSVVDVLDQLPKGIKVVFGLGEFDLTTAAGFYGVLFIYLAVMASVHAALLGAHLVAKEERDHTSEFLYAKPFSRSKVLTGKLMAGLANLVVLNLVALASSFLFVDMYNKDAPFTDDMLILMIGLFFLQLIFFSIGTAVAGMTRRPRSAASLATSIMLLMFLLYYVVNLEESLSFLKYFTSFKYFDAAVLMTDGLDPVFVGLSAIIIGIAVFGTYHFYSGRDLTV